MENNQDQQSNRGRCQIIFVVAVFIFLIISSQYSQENSSSNQKLIEFIRNQKNNEQSLSVALKYFQQDSQYIGDWVHPNEKSDSFMTTNIGKFYLKKLKQVKSDKISQYYFEIILYNGDYIDNGMIRKIFTIKSSSIDVKIDNKSITLQLQANKNISCFNSIEKILRTISNNENKINQFNLKFYIDNNNKLQIMMQFQDLNTIQKTLKIIGKDYKNTKSIIFALLLLILSWSQFSAIMKILKDIIQGTSNPLHFSTLTLMFITIWDCILCISAFFQAFTNQSNLILFIIPSFLFCLLFSNLQLRLMLTIFQANHPQTDVRNLICQFNCLSYGCFALIYPLLFLLNFNSILFFIGSCILIPQIYVNGIEGHRPDLNSPYYNRLLIGRFITIFYLRCFPYNLFDFQPDYFLSACCLVLISTQIFALWMQRIKGPKTVIPRLFLPSIYDYSYKQQINLQQTSQILECAICLNPLHQNQQQNFQELDNNNNNNNLMKTSCGHIYHSKCLKQWMNIKMMCPQCRNKLPPYQ